jgi:hypothetical protein
MYIVQTRIQTCINSVFVSAKLTIFSVMKLCCSEDVDLKYDHSQLHLYYVDLVGTRYVRNMLFSRYHLLSKYGTHLGRVNTV